MATTFGSSGAEINYAHIRVCARCGIRYDWRKSASSTLKMTYCGSLCEKADLGFTLDALIRVTRNEPPQSLPVVDTVPAESAVPAA